MGAVVKQEQPADSSPPAAEQRTGAFLENSVNTGTVIGTAGQVIIEDPDAPFDVRGLPNPYLGLRSFTYDDRATFAGRERLVVEAAALLTPPGEERSLLLVTGASGCGKSSFAEAGLRPALEAHYQARQVTLRAAAFRVGRRPLNQLADALAQLGIPTDAAQLTGAAAIGEHIAANTPGGQVNLIVLDQFEDLFSRAEPAERETLLAWLEALPPFAAARTHVVVAMRSDYLPELPARQALAAALLPGLELPALTPQELEAAIRRPLQLARPEGDRRFEDELVAELVRDAGGDPSYLPLLQLTLEDLWARGMLKVGAYRGIADALARSAATVYAFADHEGARTHPRPPRDQAAIAGIFLDLVQVAPDGGPDQDDRRRRTWDELVGQDGARVPLLGELVAMRLLSRGVEPRPDGPADVVDIAHKGLIGGWADLRGWIDAHRDLLRRRRRFEQAFAEWLRHGRQEGYLLGSVRIAEADLLELRRDVALSGEDARSFLLRSRAQTQEKLRRARLLSAALGFLLVFALVATAYAVRQAAALRVARDLAQVQLSTANAQRLAFAAQGLAASQPEIALLLAYEAASYQPNPVTEQALRDTLERAWWRSWPVARHAGVVSSATISPDGTRVLTASWDGTARLWDLDGNEVRTFPVLDDKVYDAQFSPDGQLIVTAAWDGTAQVWDLDGNDRALLDTHQALVESAAFSPDGQLIVTAAWDGTARLWDLDGNELAVLRGHEGPVRSAAFSPDGRLVVTASDDKTARLWDLDGNELEALRGHEGRVLSAAFSPDGRLVVTASDDETVRLWDLDGNERIAPSYHQDIVTSAAFSPDGQLIVTAAWDGTARVWNLDGDELAILSGHRAPVIDARFTPDGERIVTASSDRTARLWELDQRNLGAIPWLGPKLVTAEFSADGEQIFSATSDGDVRVWDREGNEVLAFSSPDAPLRYAALSPDAQRIVTSAQDNTVRVWDAAGNERAVMRGHRDIINGVAFSPDGTRVLSYSWDGTTRVWSAEGERQLVLRGRDDGVLMARFSPDGQRIVSASQDGLARIWDMDGDLRVAFGDEESPMWSAAFSPDGTRIVTGAADGAVRLWDLDGNEQEVFRGHDRFVFDVRFSPDGQQVATASGDGTVRLWDLEGNLLAVFRGHGDDVISVEFSPDGRRLLAVGKDGTARMYALAVEDLKAAAACRVGRGLTDEEIAQYAVPTPLAFDFASRRCPATLSWQK